MKVLVIRLKYIGDSLLSLPVIRSIKASHPDAEIDYLVYEHIACLFEQEDSIRKVQVINNAEKKSPIRYLQKLFKLRAEKYDVVIDLLAVPATVIISKFTGAKHIIGFDKGKGRSKFYTHPVQHVPNVSSSRQKLSLLRQMPVVIDCIKTDITLSFTDKECAEIKNRILEAGLKFARPIILFSCIARVKKKLWSEHNYIVLINRIQKQTNAQVLFAWGNEAERQQVISIAEKIKKMFFAMLNLKQLEN